MNSTLFKNYKKKETKMSSIFIKILRDHLNQIFLIYSISDIFKLNAEFFSAYNDVNDVISSSAFSFDCLFNGETMNIFFFKVITNIISPILMHFFVSIIFLLFFLVKKIFFKKPVSFKVYLKTMLIGFIVICDMQYANILVTILKMVECTELDSINHDEFLKYAPTVQCYRSDHIFYMIVIGLPSLLFWIVGLPLLYFLLLRFFNRKSEKKTKGNTNLYITTTSNLETNAQKELGAFEFDLDARLMLSFLFYDYSENKYYWTSIIMIWKTVLAFLVTFDTEGRVYLLFVFYIILNSIYSYGSPYKHLETNFLALTSFYCNMTSIILAEYISSEGRFKDEIIIINIIFHISFFILTIYLIIKEFDYQEIIGKAINFLKKKERNKVLHKITQILERLQTKIENKEKNKTSIFAKNMENKIFTDTLNTNIKSSKNAAEDQEMEIPSDEFNHYIPKV